MRFLQSSYDIRCAQGSVLGPSLFLLYINDIASVITLEAQIRAFADVLFHEIKGVHDQVELNSNLANLSKLCKNFGMTVNTDKTVSLCVTLKKTAFKCTYNLTSFPLKQVNSYKYLGVAIINDLSWNLHIDNICSSAFRKLS